MNEQNLKPIKHLSKEEAKKRGSAGGIKSGKVRKEKKLMSQIMAEFLSREHNVKFDKKKVKMSGAEQVNLVMADILDRRDSASVSLIKAIADTTEGSNLNINNNSAPVIINVVGVDSASPDPEKTTPDN